MSRFKTRASDSVAKKKIHTVTTVGYRTTPDVERPAKPATGSKRAVASNDARERRRLALFGEIIIRIGSLVVFPVDTHREEIARKLESIVLAL
jgi:hypothetical protein